ncbi:hypothetical protein DMB72_11270 [Staphylococcus saccharolyticus]|nr:hypothetical protein DMB72_11270 [Staphylococcus saccharolyticus]TAA96325.1 hypothetical protein DMB73_11255 [Staphylococcus saccharolyticus]TAB01400.1 hypothetical protein DMB78_11265 [Staphylococcus saccharolyticus]
MKQLKYRKIIKWSHKLVMTLRHKKIPGTSINVSGIFTYWQTMTELKMRLYQAFSILAFVTMMGNEFCLILFLANYFNS